MKQILLTCDTEVGELARNFDLAFELFVLGKVKGEQVGVSLINSIAREYGAIVNHFVDVYHPRYEREMYEICASILSEGHFIGLVNDICSNMERKSKKKYYHGEKTG